MAGGGDAELVYRLPSGRVVARVRRSVDQCDSSSLPADLLDFAAIERIPARRLNALPRGPEADANGEFLVVVSMSAIALRGSYHFSGDDAVYGCLLPMEGRVLVLADGSYELEASEGIPVALEETDLDDAHIFAMLRAFTSHISGRLRRERIMFGGSCTLLRVNDEVVYSRSDAVHENLAVPEGSLTSGRFADERLRARDGLLRLLGTASVATLVRFDEYDVSLEGDTTFQLLRV
jgi:hypothetical protein